MALGVCSVCGKPMASDALACPHCGTQQRPARKGMGFLTSVAVVLGVIVVLGALSSGTHGAKHTPAPHADSAQAPAPSVPDKAELQASAQRAIRAQLKDPESARFSDVFVHQTKDSLTAVCGSVNARNGFGGYDGDKAFFVIGSIALIQPPSGDASFDKFYKLWNAACSDAKH